MSATILSDAIASDTVSKCEFNFGIAGLDNPALLSDFYPDDLPEDWRFSYYSNEFHLLLISLSDLGLANMNARAVTAAQALEGLEQLADDIADADGTDTGFICALNLSDLTETMQQEMLVQWGTSNALPINCINLTQRFSVTQAETFACSFTPIQEAGVGFEANAKNKTCFAIVEAANVLEPKALRHLLETIQAYTITENYHTMNIIFSTSQQALTNCRNAQLLASLM
ncbi:hypothetical protein [sulfur-oxidizing endosymbiont of Gigantopelta aegis]|uniref:hypothetical protein n=1 Tax=sulfur-oxidizing endosymbiont of Gigantopelta aegis TaxID=2794934 RepID=UPI0018DE92B0|nr:hypothetical protein [sulfur-oxidizing endosymbiont of Gigantopelta aegis]